MNRPRAIAPRTLVKAVAIALSSFANKQHIASEVRGWRDTKDAELVIKAATSPASLTQSGWADTLAMSSVQDFVGVLAPASAGSDLLKRGLQFTFDGAATITVPSVVASASYASFVQEGAAIPVRQFSFTGPQLAPRKFGTLTEFTYEIFQHSKPTIELLIKAALTESVALALDAAMFSATAGDAIRPPGLLQGIAALTPSAATDPAQAAVKDAAKLAAAVSAVAGNGPIIFLCSPAQSVALRLSTMLFPYDVLVSSALAAGTVIAIAPNGLASATNSAPRFDISNETTIVERDDPAPISTSGTLPTIAVPTRSLWQTDTLSLRMIFEMSWCLRHPNALAWMQNVLW